MLAHIIESQQFDRLLLEELFASAKKLEGVREESLKGQILASLFYEPSTRTRFSFESAMYRLGGEVITAENANEMSSSVKGESLEDAIRVMNHYADIIVLRHPEAGAAARAVEVSDVPVINAGDGSGQHPTQALLDLYTMHRELGSLDGTHLVVVGDARYYRSARSLIYLLAKFEDITVTVVSLPELGLSDEMKEHLDEEGVTYHETTEITEAMKVGDAVYQTRIQNERLKKELYDEAKGKYVIDRPLADSMKQGGIIIHPLPRVGEIMPEVDDSEHAVYFKQVGYGLHVRMALLKMLF